jgi:hypothetical protein
MKTSCSLALVSTLLLSVSVEAQTVPHHQTDIKVLFIGNSHTYVNDMPKLFAAEALKDNIRCDVVMLTLGGWHLAQHVKEPQIRFNIQNGHYDYVVLQEYTHPFGPEQSMHEAVAKLGEWIKAAGSTPVMYMTWAKKGHPEQQAELTNAYTSCAKEINALLAPVGVEWWRLLAENPSLELYRPDGEHASADGSRLAATIIWKTIRQHYMAQKP